MNVELRPVKTDAEQALSAAFADARARLPGKGAIADLRDGAIKRFETRGLPHRRVEEWKYTDLRALMRTAYPLAAAPDAAARARVREAGGILRGVDRQRLVFVDGVFAPDLSDLPEDGEEGITIGSLAEALAKADPLVTQHIGKTFATEDVAVALNTALMGDGAVIKIGAGVVPRRPIHLIFASSSEKPSASYVRSLVVVETGAQATIIETHEAGASQVNSALELIVGDDAQVDYIRTTQGRSLQIASLLARIGARARVSTFAFAADTELARSQALIRFAGEAAKADIRGVSLLRGKDHVDNTLLIEHAAPHCVSREQFRAVLDNDARSVFQGKIVVEPQAQKTDAKMLTRALLLSETAEADNKPELEIFADDVVCGHGATAGALDKGLKFYLMARGIPEREAEALLIQAFIGETVDEIAHDGIREALMFVSLKWLGARA